MRDVKIERRVGRVDDLSTIQQTHSRRHSKLRILQQQIKQPLVLLPYVKSLTVNPEYVASINKPCPRQLHSQCVAKRQQKCQNGGHMSRQVDLYTPR